MTAQAERHRLERKVDLLSKALHLLLFEENETISKKEASEIRSRLSSYLKGSKDDFVDLEDVLNAGSKNKQKSSKSLIHCGGCKNQDSPCLQIHERRSILG